MVGTAKGHCLPPIRASSVDGCYLGFSVSLKSKKNSRPSSLRRAVVDAFAPMTSTGIESPVSSPLGKW